jgi:hypothetical protein
VSHAFVLCRGRLIVVASFSYSRAARARAIRRVARVCFVPRAIDCGCELLLLAGRKGEGDSTVSHAGVEPSEARVFEPLMAEVAQLNAHMMVDNVELLPLVRVNQVLLVMLVCKGLGSIQLS